VLLRCTVPLPAGHAGNRFAKPRVSQRARFTARRQAIRRKKNQMTTSRTSG
jgi:hypothetical protein